ncbi:hypothetical protein [Rhizobium sp. 57MFTsu3.2]|uniref:hypothetical protein n=1 Tax=Rhizobium sp. 57MFTsu3.2 TaxID=1048681 RepID=UPI00146AFA8B|nr:hypothetical protein [Rhizobium sp. 57MFTsu3.2]NMN73128.1 hypothetical protein [Rhizobium sp. 57MFTsu3.2]
MTAAHRSLSHGSRLVVLVLALHVSTVFGGSPPTSGFRPLNHTGVIDETVLKKFEGTYYVGTDNTVVENLEIRGNIVVEAKNVTIRNIRLNSGTPWHAIIVADEASGFTLQDSDIDGGGGTVNGVLGFGLFLRNSIRGVDNGINVTGPSIIRENHIFGLFSRKGGHYDGIEINGGHDIEITGNDIVNDHGQTSAVMMNNEFSGLSNIVIENNRLVGGGYTVYLDGRKGGGAVNAASIRIITNEIGAGHWGEFAFYDSKPVVEGNQPTSH